MKRINKVVLVSLISLTSLIVSAQDTTKIISTDYFKANEKIHKVNMNMAYISNTGKQQGKPIRVKYTIPLTFNLSEPAESKTSHKKNYDRRITEW
jgi:hypothetical protein